MTLFLASSSGLRLDEGEQVRIELVRMDDRHAMWKTGVDLELSILDQLGRKGSSVRKGHDLVIVPVHDEGGNVDLLQVFGEVGLGEGVDPVVLWLETALHALIPEVVPHAFGDFGSRPVVAEEGKAQLFEELRTIVECAGTDAVKDFDG